MAQHGALETLKDLAEKEVDDAARLLGEMRRQRLQAWQTLQDRQTAAALLAENRMDQKKMDEFAQRAAMRKPE